MTLNPTPAVGLRSKRNVTQDGFADFHCSTSQTVMFLSASSLGISQEIPHTITWPAFNPISGYGWSRCEAPADHQRTVLIHLYIERTAVAVASGVDTLIGHLRAP